MAQMRREKVPSIQTSQLSSNSQQNLPFPALPAQHPANVQYSAAVLDDEDEDDDDGSSTGQDEGLLMQLNAHGSFDTDPKLERLRRELRGRGTSIKFDSLTHADDGRVHTLEERLPKLQNTRLASGNGIYEHNTPTHAIPIRQRPRGHSETEKGDFDARTGKPLRDGHQSKQVMQRTKYHKGEMRYPLVQTTVDELANESFYSESRMIEDASTLGSDHSLASLDGDEIHPLSMSALVESKVSSSPVLVWPQQRSTLPSRRSVSQRSFGSLGSAGRRHNLRSNTSSLTSPARSFLSQWTRNEEAVKEPDPDEEGQEIGDGSGYIIGRKIGYGGFSTIKEVTSIENDQRIIRAVKIVRKQLKDKTDVENETLQSEFEREVDVWRYLQHPYVLPLIAVFDTNFATFCITRLNQGGTLFDLVRARRKAASGTKESKGLSAKLAKRYIYQLGSAIRYLHEDVRVVHRDIKPENCLLDMSGPRAETEGGNVLLCDFGMADFIYNEHRVTEGPDPSNSRENLLEGRQNGNIVNVGPSLNSTNIQGSLEYTAPELCSISKPVYSTAADIWAFGCVAYTLLAGERPFYHEFQPRLLLMIEKGAYNDAVLLESPTVQEDGNASAVDFVRGCLTLEPQERFTISQALEHEFLSGCKELYEPLDNFT